MAAAALAMDAALDDLVASLADALVTRAADAFEVSWAIDDPAGRVEELLADSREEYGEYDTEVMDRVEQESYSAMLDAAEQLADRERDGDGDDRGW